MANWTAITEEAVRTGKISIFLDTVQSLATAATEADPLSEMIADVVARIRASVSTGNRLDQDTSKIPNSLKGVALRMITRRLKDYCQQPLTSDELAQQKDDQSYLQQIITEKVRFELPDTPGTDEMQVSPAIQVGHTNKDTLGSIPGADTTRVSSRDRLRNL